MLQTDARRTAYCRRTSTLNTPHAQVQTQTHHAPRYKHKHTTRPGTNTNTPLVQVQPQINHMSMYKHITSPGIATNTCSNTPPVHVQTHHLSRYSHKHMYKHITCPCTTISTPHIQVQPHESRPQPSKALYNSPSPPTIFLVCVNFQSMSHRDLQLSVLQSGPHGFKTVNKVAM